MKPREEPVDQSQPNEPAAPDPSHIVRSLRKYTGQTQDAAAKKSGELIANEFSRIEIGYNQCTSGRIRNGLARAFDVWPETMAAVLDGKISLEEAYRHVGESTQRKEAPRLADRDEWARVLPEAQARYREFYGASNPTLWTEVGDVLDSQPYPRPLTPAFVAKLAHALAPPPMGVEAPSAAPRPEATATARRRRGRSGPGSAAD